MNSQLTNNASNNKFVHKKIVWLLDFKDNSLLKWADRKRVLTIIIFSRKVVDLCQKTLVGV